MEELLVRAEKKLRKEIEFTSWREQCPERIAQEYTPERIAAMFAAAQLNRRNPFTEIPAYEGNLL